MLCAYNEVVKGGVKFIARVLREQAEALDKRSGFCNAASFCRNFGAKQRGLKFKICGSAAR